MEKHTIELWRDPNYPIDYFTTYKSSGPLGENGILNKIVEWSQRKNVLIYKHIERIVDEPPFREEEQTWTSGKKNVRLGNRVQYLDIYYQKKHREESEEEVRIYGDFK